MSAAGVSGAVGGMVQAGVAGGGPAGLRRLLLSLGARDPVEQAQLLRRLPGWQRRRILAHWEAWAHPAQLPPADDWAVWLIRAGRGFGKTRAGAEWVTAMAAAVPGARIALVGATAEDVARVMVEGESGLLAVTTGARPRWKRTQGELRFDGGAVAHVYSAEAPERLRGPQHHLAWCDELGAWRYGDATWDNLMLGLRLGDRPRTLVTTTPRPTSLMRRVIALPGVAITVGRTRDNPHLPDAFVAGVEGLYGGTRLGRQELDGELIEDQAGALWPRDLIERQRADPALVPAQWARVLIGVDPPAGTVSGEGGDACGIVAVAQAPNGRLFVIEDASVAGASSASWADAVAACAARHGADRVVAEANQGGRMVEAVLRASDAALPLRLVHARHGKSARAEPVAALYEAGRAWHLGRFAALEAELAGLMAGGGYQGPGRSPDRADALVWR